MTTSATKPPFAPTGDAGEFTLDAAFIARAFDMSEARVRALMGRKLFRSRVERGEAENAGSWRLTLRCGNRVWQGVVTGDGVLRQQAAGFAPPLGGSPDRSSDLNMKESLK